MAAEPDVTGPLPLSAVIITLNEEANLPRCLSSLRGLAAEFLVVDSGSSDRTREIAASAGARVERQPWLGHVRQKNAALGLASQPWALSVDADEEVSAELADAIRALFEAGGPALDGYKVNRLNYYLGAWIRHAWYPEWRLRLVRSGCAEWRGSDPHDRLETAGAVGRLDGHLHHYSYADLDDHFRRLIRYARIAAESRAAEGRPVRWYHLAVSPWLAFFKSLILRQAWRDGWRGWVIAFATLVKVFAKYAFIYEKRLAGRP
ncbi:MAG: glycosyltransferase family 2 protein [Vicinamibacterales bacterium]